MTDTKTKNLVAQAAAVFRLVSEEFQVSVRELQGTSQSLRISRPRNCLAFLLSEHTGLSNLGTSAALKKCPSYTSVIRRKLNQRRKTDPNLDAIIKRLASKL